MFYQGSRKRRPVLQLAPMIDVVFLLLIFFMVATTFRDDLGIELDKPEAETAQPMQLEPLVFAISAKHELYYKGKPVTLEEAEGLLKSVINNQGKVPVIVQTDRNARTGVLIRFLDMARKAGVEDLAVGAQHAGAYSTKD